MKSLQTNTCLTCLYAGCVLKNCTPFRALSNIPHMSGRWRGGAIIRHPPHCQFASHCQTPHSTAPGDCHIWRAGLHGLHAGSINSKKVFLYYILPSRWTNGNAKCTPAPLSIMLQCQNKYYLQIHRCSVHLLFVPRCRCIEVWTVELWSAEDCI